MDQSVLEIAKDLVKSQIQAGHLTPEEVQQALVDTHVQLMALQAKGQTGDVQRTARSTGAINWRESITQRVIKCLECGAVTSSSRSDISASTV